MPKIPLLLLILDPPSPTLRLGLSQRALVSTQIESHHFYPPTGRVERQRGEGQIHGRTAYDDPITPVVALPARSSRPSRREGEDRCVDTNAVEQK